MAATLATATNVTKETAREFFNDLTFLANVNRTYDDQYMLGGAKVGNTVLARMPQRFQATDGQSLQLQNIFDQTVPITLTNQKNVAFGWSSAQATTEIQEVKSRYTKPGGEALANAAEVLAFTNTFRDIYNAVGTLGTTPTSILTYLQAGTKLTDGASPLKGRVAVLDPLAMQTLVNSQTTTFNPSAVIGESYENGMFGRRQLGVDKWFQDPIRPTFTSGACTSASTPLVNGAGQTGSTLNCDGWGSGASNLKKGDIFTIGGVNQVNPLAYSSVGRLQQFVVTADTADVTGAMTALPISPSIITSGQLQTVDASPADNAVITLWSMAAGGTLAATASPQSFVYHPDAFAFVMADLIKPGAGAESYTVRSKSLGFAIRMVEQYQIGTDQNPSRLDILIGAATLQPRLACRVVG